METVSFKVKHVRTGTYNNRRSKTEGKNASTGRQRGEETPRRLARSLVCVGLKGETGFWARTVVILVQDGECIVDFSLGDGTADLAAEFAELEGREEGEKGAGQRNGGRSGGNVAHAIVDEAYLSHINRS